MALPSIYQSFWYFGGGSKSLLSSGGTTQFTWSRLSRMLLRICTLASVCRSSLRAAVRVDRLHHPFWGIQNRSHFSEELREAVGRL